MTRKEINEQLLVIHTEILRLKSYEAKRISAERTLKTEQQELRKRQEILEKENRDVSVAKNGLLSYWFELLGTKDEKLRKEQQEAVEAELAYQSQQSLVTALQSEIQTLQYRLSNAAQLHSRWEELLAEKKKAVVTDQDESSELVTSVLDKLSVLKAEQKELQEAIDAGEQTYVTLNDVLTTLNKAKNYATWDVWGGGGLADYFKYGEINKATGLIQKAQYELNHFARELSDLNLRILADLNVEGFDKFADWFLDNIFTDWAVRNRITNAYDSASRLQEEVKNILTELRSKKVENEKQQETIQEEYVKLMVTIE